ncbi:tRNA lysidine(34) synthetase TilS [Agrobacterium pusense]|jgi:tRNA(Ile)-lysidine synthase|uniref:tRNA(Ile)-lysidine synthase n=1 Tax=Agrobacterium pusense TaxID=648995 RepID=U4QDC4_9HYPH|nr:tRNA lysidine(34) synthetase TilS [Agrobacterium pusense]OAI84271.1 tRNA(Ile)-lysidine synthetase [Rhizobium sp. GHKF11]MDR6191212.1 tRNA(Ile)-lysidine synthase [Agrobacterium pusense]NRF09411.1 tRNA lysidine(34) synthetase TilS [Agrobacterium pusense]NRF19684.1 tRNA lysidine(34) synthetase TilS [Agrobacterium pusense]WFN88115.1 tRNA lysidine(34) synthetase TilS [Agrobacterium pusense]
MPVDVRIPNEQPIAPLAAARSFVEKFREPAHILVAISGGSDSTGLLLALHEVMSEKGRDLLRLSAVTVDHALRVESADEARKVATLCAELGIPHVTRRWEGLKPVSGISEASRLARYRLIAEAAVAFDADLVVTGHTAGDQRETVAMRAARNSGEDNLGLSGMADAVLYARRHWIMRPFLRCERQAIRDYVSSRSRRWLDDPSNENPRYERVRMRQALPDVPLPADGGEAEKRRISSEKTAVFLRAHAEVFSGALAKLQPDGVSPDRADFRHGLAVLIASLGGRPYLPAAGSMERVLCFLKTGNYGRMTVGRVLLDRRRDGLYIFREQRNLPELRLEAYQKGLWDDRFIVENRSPFPVRVSAEEAGTGAGFPSVPPGVTRLALSGLPQIAAAEAGETVGELTVDVTPRLAPFDLFLPRFDLELANTIAVLFGRPAYPQPPV